MEREEVIVQQQRDVSNIAMSKKSKGKARARDLSMDGDALNDKYREAVEEKKGWRSIILLFYTLSISFSFSIGSSDQLIADTPHAPNI
jgi:hypothetical protein